jgi:hypothetical protein
MSDLSLSNYPDLLLSAYPAILEIQQQQKEKTHGT